MHTHAKCFELIDRLEWVAQVIHVYREGNRAADWLANHGVIQNVTSQILTLVPCNLHTILMEDISGVAFLRLVPP